MNNHFLVPNIEIHLLLALDICIKPVVGLMIRSEHTPVVTEVVSIISQEPPRLGPVMITAIVFPKDGSSVSPDR